MDWLGGHVRITRTLIYFCRERTPCSTGKALRLSGAETLQHRDVTGTMIYFCRVGTPCSTGKALTLSGAETLQHRILRNGFPSWGVAPGYSV